ncbi:MAG: ATP-binding protein [Myxococcota bacterium]
MGVDYRNHTILYVDDDRANLLAVQYALEDTFRIEIAMTPEEALEQLATHRVAVLLADHRMPGMTGVELCERAREVSPDTARIILTGYADVHAAIDAVNRGQVMRYLQKPIENEALEEILRAAIEVVHATETVRHLRSRILSAGADVSSRSTSSAAARALDNPTAELRRIVGYGRDLLRILKRATEEERRHELTHELERTFADLYEVTERFATLQKKLNAGARIEEEEQIDLARIVHGAARMLGPRLPASTRLNVSIEAVPRVTGRASAIAQIITNLVLNAAEATAEVANAEIRIEVRQRRGMAVLSVSDNGPGVPDHLRERVFDPQFSTRTGSSGLGLSVARQLAVEAGGTLVLLPTRDDGACFAARFPLDTNWEEESGEHLREGFS